MLRFQMYLDLEKIIGDIIKYGLIIIGLMIGLAILAKIFEFFFYMSVEIKMDKHGVRKVEIVDVNYENKDDTLERAGFGYMVAGERGWLLGAMMGQQYEELKSVTFMIYYKNRTTQKVTCSPKKDLFRKLVKLADH